MSKTTVIIPTLNSEKYLRETLRSLKQNNKSIFKIFIIDAGSNDNTVKIIKEEKLKNLNFFLVKKNIAKSLDFGLSRLKTLYFSRIDSDDVAMKDRFKKQIYYLKKDKNLAAVGSNVLFVKDKSIIKKTDLPLSYESILTKFFVDGDIALAHPATSLRVQSVKNVGGYENYNFSEDYNLWIRLVFKKYKIINLAENLTNIRVHEFQKSTLTHEKSIKSMMNSYIKNIKRNLEIKLSGSHLKLLMVKYLKKDNFTINDIKNFYKKKFMITEKKIKYFKIKINVEELISFELQNINFKFRLINFIYYFYLKKKFILKIIKIVKKEKNNYFFFNLNFYIYFFLLLLKYFIHHLK